MLISSIITLLSLSLHVFKILTLIKKIFFSTTDKETSLYLMIDYGWRLKFRKMQELLPPILI